MPRFRSIQAIVLVFILVIFSQKVFAGDSGLLKLEIQDAVAFGLGGAFVGEADRPAAVYYNPGGITQMDSVEVSADLTWVQPHLKYESSDAAHNGAAYTATMKQDNYLFPNEFISVPVFKDKLFLGIGESSDFGGGNDWEANSFSQYSTVKDSIVNQDYRLAAAYKITDQWSMGVAVINEESKFEHDLGLYQGASNGDILFKATDNAWGFDIGAIFKLNDQNQFGLNYKSPISHTYDGKAYFSNLDTGVGLGALLGVTSLTTKAIQKLTLPQSVTLGYNLKPTDKWLINFDLSWTDWSRYKEQVTYYPDLSPAVAGAFPGPQSRDWRSVWAESLGAQYAVTDNFRVRMGYEHHQTPVPKTTFNTEFADSDSHTIMAGIGYDITRNLTIDVTYGGSIYTVRNITNTVDNSLGAYMNGKYKAFVNIGTATMTYKF